MAYTTDSSGDIIISGFSNGIGDSPHAGLTDLRGLNITSVPGEAPLNFSLASVTNGAVSGTITSVSGTTATFTLSTGSLDNAMAVYFSTTGTLTAGTAGTPYWVQNLASNTFSLTKAYSDVGASPNTQLLNFSSGSGATFVAYQVGAIPKDNNGSPFATGALGGPIQYFAQPTNVTTANPNAYIFAVDGSGLVWGNLTTTQNNSFWTYTGNYISDGTGGLAGADKGVSNASGNGLVYWRVNDNGTGLSNHFADYLIVFRNSQMDMMLVQQGPGSVSNESVKVWNYGWDPNTNTFNGNNHPVLSTPPGNNGSHHAIIGPDGRIYFCDWFNVHKLSQTSSNTIFDPTTASSTYSTYNLLPTNDSSQCIAPSGTNMLIGGQGYFVYHWNTTSNLVDYAIPVAEPFIARIVTVNVNSYIFAGNRGRIFITNGSQANLWKKMPDHLAGTIEPRYTWGGATAVRNQLYFSFKTVQNNGNALANPIGGIYAIDLDTGALRLANQLSYGTYSGYANALTPQIYNPTTNVNATGVAYYAGWDDGTGSNFGIDQPSNNVYTGGQAWVTSDIIPIGKLFQPKTVPQFEVKLATPLVAGESITLYQGDYLDMSYASFATLGTMTFTSNVNQSNLAANFPAQKQSSQWALVRAVSTGTSGTISFNRISEIRIVGGANKVSAMYQPGQ